MRVSPPIVVLVRPQMGENIGAVARAMANFGLEDLRLVAPRDGWPNAQAEAMAAGAQHLLDRAALYDTLPSALSDVTHVYATTARPRDLVKPVLTPEAAIANLLSHHAPGHAALVFGPERTGLTNEEIAWCHFLITIPTAAHASLNLAQSAILLGYLWHRARSEAHTHALPTTHTPATMEEYASLFQQLERYLEASDFFKVAEKKPGMWQNIQTVCLRGAWTSQEVRTMHGIFRALFERKE